MSPLVEELIGPEDKETLEDSTFHNLDKLRVAISGELADLLKNPNKENDFTNVEVFARNVVSHTVERHEAYRGREGYLCLLSLIKIGDGSEGALKSLAGIDYQALPQWITLRRDSSLQDVVEKGKLDSVVSFAYLNHFRIISFDEELYILAINLEEMEEGNQLYESISGLYKRQSKGCR
jgi:hypothetical protein